MAIPAGFIQELLARADVVEVVGRYVQLKKSGANFSGLCPFHSEKSPSFSVSPTKQFYHCFGCGKHGDAINFLMEHTGVSFVEAVQDLAQQLGMQVPQEESSPQDRARANEQRQKQVTLCDVLEKAGEAYRKQLKQSQRAIDYLKKRGLSGEIARDFGLGYAPAGWRHLANVFPQYDDPLLVESGLVITGESEEGGDQKRYDRFRDRIMFPIRNVKGECIGFGGRVMGDEKPKYLNSPETPVFSKGHELYGLFEARNAIRQAGYVLVTEGYMDVVALAQWGFAQAVATLGTACTADHVHKLFRFTDTVVFSFDGDAAGRKAARRALEAALPYASDVRSVKFLFLPAEHDPDSYVRANGTQAFADCVRDAVPLSRFLLDAASEDCDLLVAEGRARMARQAQALWNALPDGALKRQLLGDIAARVQLSAADLTQLWAGSTEQAPSRSNTGQRRSRNASTDEAPSSAYRSERGARSSPNAPTPTSRRRTGVNLADKLLRLLLARSHLWNELSHAEHELLCALPAPHGDLLKWLEAQLHDQGPLPWGTLHDSLQNQPQTSLAPMTSLAQQLMQDADLLPGSDAAESTTELRNLLHALHLERIRNEETQALQALALTPDDPGAQQRYRDARQQRQSLISANTQTSDAPADR